MPCRRFIAWFAAKKFLDENFFSSKEKKILLDVSKKFSHVFSSEVGG
jgi:hypothetical protein